MTASVPAASNAAVPSAARPGAVAEPRDDTAAAGFDSQLHAARQQHDASSANDASSGSKDEHRPTPAARAPLDPPTDPAPAAKPGVMPAAPVSAAAPAEPADVPAADAPAPRREPGDEPATAVVDAMFALLGSSVAGVLAPVADGARGALAQTGKGVAVNAGAAAMLQLAAAAGPAAAPVNVVPQAASMLAAAQAAPPAANLLDKEASKAPAAAAVLAAPPATAAPLAAHQLQLPTPPASPSFGQDLGQQVAWLSGQNIKQARIRLHPEELGSLDVSVSVTHGRVDVVFSAQHAAAIPAVQQSLPQLDQMLARHGLSLGHTEVGQRDRGDRRGPAGSGGAGALDEVADSHGGVSVILGKVGLLDAFA